MATPKPTASTSVVGLIGGWACWSLSPCAKAAGAIIIIATSASTAIAAFFMDFLLVNCRQEVVPGHRAAGLTLKRLQNLADQVIEARLSMSQRAHRGALQCSSAVANPM